MLKNIVLINHNKNWGLEEETVEKLAQKALIEKKLTNGIELSLFFVGKKKAKSLNLDYRKMSYIPQVLGFPMSKDKDADGRIRLGDVVICTQKLKYEVKFQESDLNTILYDWLLHGIDNLLKD